MHIQHYTERAAGGCGLICVEATAVTPGGRFCKTHMGLWNDDQIEGHKAIVEGCHNYGAVTIIQLNPTGYTANPECGLPVGPSAIQWNGYRGEYTTIEMSLLEIKEMQKAFVDAAIRAKKAGYDYLQVSSGMTSLETLKTYSNELVSDIQSLGVYFHEHFKNRIPVSCVGGILEPSQVNYLIENDYVDTVDIARAVLADPNFANAVIDGSSYTKCFSCKACQYGSFTAHTCPAEKLRKNA